MRVLPVRLAKPRKAKESPPPTRRTIFAVFRWVIRMLCLHCLSVLHVVNQRVFLALPNKTGGAQEPARAARRPDHGLGLWRRPLRKARARPPG